MAKCVQAHLWGIDHFVVEYVLFQDWPGLSGWHCPVAWQWEMLTPSLLEAGCVQG